MQDYTIRLVWNDDHFDVFIPELGTEVRTTGKTKEEAQDKGQAIIEQIWTTEYERQEKTVA